MADTKKPNKTPRRAGALLVLLDENTERPLVDAAAERAGLATGSWIRMVTLNAARQAQISASPNVPPKTPGKRRK